VAGPLNKRQKHGLHCLHFQEGVGALFGGHLVLSALISFVTKDVLEFLSGSGSPARSSEDCFGAMRYLRSLAHSLLNVCGSPRQPLLSFTVVDCLQAGLILPLSGRASSRAQQNVCRRRLWFRSHLSCRSTCTNERVCLQLLYYLCLHGSCSVSLGTLFCSVLRAVSKRRSFVLSLLSVHTKMATTA
jgi:hypothetical protein